MYSRSTELSQRGQGLLVIVVVLVFIMLLAAGAMLAGSFTEFKASFLDRDKRKAETAALAGIEDGRIKIVRNPAVDHGCSAGSPCEIADTFFESAGNGSSAAYSIVIGSVTSPCSGNRLIDSTGYYRRASADSTKRFAAVLSADAEGAVVLNCLREVQP